MTGPGSARRRHGPPRSSADRRPGAAWPPRSRGRACSGPPSTALCRPISPAIRDSSGLARKSAALTLGSAGATWPRTRTWRPTSRQWKLSAACGPAASWLPLALMLAVANSQPSASTSLRMSTRASGRPSASTVESVIAEARVAHAHAHGLFPRLGQGLRGEVHADEEGPGFLRDQQAVGTPAAGEVKQRAPGTEPERVSQFRDRLGGDRASPGARREAHVPVHDPGDDLRGGLVRVPAVEVLGGQQLRGHRVSIGSWIEESGFQQISGRQEGALV